tara:strand:+ start:3039 stop:3335 length:297 start_codon:yes stop_codon:yes gene_type:complete
MPIVDEEPKIRKQPSEIKSCPKAEISPELHGWAKQQAKKAGKTEAAFFGGLLEVALIEERLKHEKEELSARLSLFRKTDPAAFKELIDEVEGDQTFLP